MTDMEFNERDSYMKHVGYLFKEKTSQELLLYREWFEERSTRELPKLQSMIIDSDDGYYAPKVFGKYWRDLVPIYVEKARDCHSARALIYSCVNFSFTIQ